MPLSKIGALFPGTSHTTPVTVTNRDGLLYVQKAEFWDERLPNDPVTMVFIAKSPVVTGLSRIYKSTAAMLLEAETQDLMYQFDTVDSRMVYGRVQTSLLRLCAADNPHRELYPADEVFERIHAHNRYEVA